jgi:manganese efflux pump family protein
VPAGAQGASSSRVPVPPERHFPLPVVIGHGVLAVTTILLVLLTALHAFGSGS